MTINIPGIDVKKGLDLYDGEEDIYLIVLRSYAKNTPAVVDKIRNVSQETLGDYAISVHGIKGTSANIGAVNIQTAAAELEKLAKAGNLDEVLARNKNLINEIENTLQGIITWLEQNPDD
ncbi:MAG: Hpt domain-containing protein [Treponema sp.]|jgi:HPt (histidine-containing phosphotransfer) domain-containing protein|nr:Hpt domain-containing protein [Treponema sp.]